MRVMLQQKMPLVHYLALQSTWCGVFLIMRVATARCGCLQHCYLARDAGSHAVARSSNNILSGTKFAYSSRALLACLLEQQQARSPLLRAFAHDACILLFSGCSRCGYCTACLMLASASCCKDKQQL
jgi:hypothetical protein